LSDGAPDIVRPVRPLPMLALVVALAACGGGSKSPADSGGSGGGGGSDAGSCDAEATLTASGAFTGTRSAPATTANHGTTTDRAPVIGGAAFGTPFLSGWSFTFMGEPRVTTYTEATAGLSCVATLTDAADPNRVWTANKGVQGVPDQGTCSLTLTSVVA